MKNKAAVQFSFLMKKKTNFETQSRFSFSANEVLKLRMFETIFNDDTTTINDIFISGFMFAHVFV